jgi:hypothetical protein
MYQSTNALNKTQSVINIHLLHVSAILREPSRTNEYDASPSLQLLQYQNSKMREIDKHEIKTL